jgi:uncharacterized phage protein (TIGR02220 family)
VTNERFRVQKDENLAPILVFPATYRFFLAHDKVGREALSLYVHLIFTAELQRNHKVWATNSYLRNGLGIGEKKLRELKAFLHKYGLIQYIQEREKGTGRYLAQDDGGRVFIRVLYKAGEANAALPEPGEANAAPLGPVGQETGRADSRPCRPETQIPKTRNRNFSQEEKPVAFQLTTEANHVLDYLNEKAGKKFRHTKTSQKHILARLREGFAGDDCRVVVDRKVADWSGNPEMAEYIRPQTLFGTKFESYLNSGSEIAQAPPEHRAESTHACQSCGKPLFAGDIEICRDCWERERSAGESGLDEAVGS